MIMVLHTPRLETCLKVALVVAAISITLYQCPLVLWGILKIIGAFAAFGAFIWCLFQTLDMLNAFNIKWERTRKDDKKNAFQNREFEKHRESTYPSYPSGIQVHTFRYIHTSVYHKNA